MTGVIVYIDAANILFSAEDCGFDIDILRLMQYLKDRLRTDNILYFTGRFASKAKMFESLEAAGVEMVYKQIYNENNKTKANCDVEISHRITRDILCSDIQKIVVLSGDGDFVCLYDFARSRNIDTKVFAFDPGSCSRTIKRRPFTKVSFLIESIGLYTKEKPPAST